MKTQDLERESFSYSLASSPEQWRSAAQAREDQVPQGRAGKRREEREKWAKVRPVPNEWKGGISKESDLEVGQGLSNGLIVGILLVELGLELLKEGHRTVEVSHCEKAISNGSSKSSVISSALT